MGPWVRRGPGRGWRARRQIPDRFRPKINIEQVQLRTNIEQVQLRTDYSYVRPPHEMCTAVEYRPYTGWSMEKCCHTRRCATITSQHGRTRNDTWASGTSTLAPCTPDSSTARPMASARRMASGLFVVFTLSLGPGRPGSELSPRVSSQKRTHESCLDTQCTVSL